MEGGTEGLGDRHDKKEQEKSCSEREVAEEEKDKTYSKRKQKELLESALKCLPKG